MSVARSVIFNIIGKDSASPAFLAASKSAEAAATRVERTAARIQKSGAAMQVAGVKMSKAFTLPVIAAAAVSADQAIKFQKNMTLIETAADESAKKTAAISKGIKKVATETGTSLTDLGEGIYTVAKAGAQKWSAAEQLKVLKAAAQGAKAENVDLGTAVDALTTIMQGYGMKASDAVKAENMLIRGSGLAKTSMQEFAGSLASVVPLAASLNISFPQIAGAIATMTQHGETADRATQNLANLITNLAGQSHQSSAMMQQLGINVVDLQQHLGKRGLTGTLEIVENALAKSSKGGRVVVDAFKKSQTATADLATELSHMPPNLQKISQQFEAGKLGYADYRKAVRGLGGDAFEMGMQFISTMAKAKGFSDQLKSGDPTVRTAASTLQKMLGGVTGMRTALMLGGTSAKGFASNVDSVAEAARKSGADVLGWSKTQGTLSVKIDKAKASLQVMAVEIGTALIPAISKVVGWVTKAVNWFENLSSTDKKFIGYSAVVLAALGPVLAIVGRITKAIGLMWAMGAASGRFIAGIRGAEISLAGMESRAYLTGLKIRGMSSALRGAAGLLGGAAIGYGVGSITANASTASKAMGVLGSAAGGAAIGFAVGGPLGAGVGALAGGLSDVATMFFKSGDAAKRSAATAAAALRAERQTVKNLTQAIQEDSGAIGQNTRAYVAKSLQDKGVLDAAQKLHISLSTVTSAALGKPAAQDAVTKKVQNYIVAVQKLYENGQQLTPQQERLFKAASLVNSAFNDTSSAVGKAMARYQQLGHAIGGATAKQIDNQNAVRAQLTTIGKLQDRLAVLGRTKTSPKVDAQISGLQAKLKSAKSQLSKLGGEKPTPKVDAQISKLESAVARAQKRINALRGRTVPIDANVANAITGIRRVGNALERLHGKTIVMKTIYSSTGKHVMEAAGGPIIGPGTGTSDSIPARLSNGEYVINARQAGKHRALLDAINSGARGFKAGGAVGGMKVGDLITSGGLGHLWIAKLDQAGKQLTATVLSVAASLHKVRGSSSSAVSHAIAGAVAPDPTTPAGWMARLAAQRKVATADREQYEIAKQNLDLLNKRAAAEKRNAQNLADDASAMKSHTKAQRAAKDAAEERAKAAQKVADAVGKEASRAKADFDKIKSASQAATQKLKSDAQSLVAAVQSDFDTLQQNIQTFESSITQGLTAGSDLASIWGNLTSNADSAKQALDAAQSALEQATPDTSKLAAAQSAQAAATAAQAAAHAALTQALAGGDAAAILAAQQAQTTAASQLAAAQAAATAAAPTADQLAAQAAAQQDLTAAQQAYNAALNASSASGVSSVLDQFKASEQQFVKDLNTLKAGGAGQDLITQLAGMGATAGDALAQGLINDPKSLAAISKSMDAINNIAGKESDKLAQGYYGAGVKSMQQLLAGIEKQFPSLVKGLAPLAAQLAAMFTFTPTVTGKTVTTDALHQLGTVAKDYGVTVAALIAANPSLKGDNAKSAIKKGTHLTIPSFAQGVTDFAGGVAMVHRDELLVNLPKGSDVVPANRAKSSPFAGQDNSAVVTELRGLRAQVSTLADEIGEVQARVGAGLYVKAGAASADRRSRYRKQGVTV